jgi:hypothetical protein
MTTLPPKPTFGPLFAILTSSSPFPAVSNLALLPLLLNRTIPDLPKPFWSAFPISPASDLTYIQMIIVFMVDLLRKTNTLLQTLESALIL